MAFFIHAGGRWRQVYFEQDGQLRVAGWARRARLLKTARRNGARCLVPDDATDPRRIQKGPELLERLKSPKSLNRKNCINSHKNASDTSSQVETTHKNLRKPANPNDKSKSVEQPNKVQTCENKSSPAQHFFRTHESQKISQASNKYDELIRREPEGLSLSNKSESKTEKLNPKSPSPFAKTVHIITRESDSDETDAVKELIISEEVVSILRRFIKKNKTNVDLHLFDTDDSYKTLVFYKICPLVRLERCTAIANILAKGNTSIMSNKKRKQATTWISMISSEDSESSTNNNNNKSTKTYSPPPQKDAMVFLPSNDFRSPKRTNTLRSPKRTKTLLLPKRTKILLSPKTTKTLRSPKRTKTLLLPKRTKTLLSPKTTKTLLSPKRTKTLLSPKTTKTLLSPKRTKTMLSPERDQYLSRNYNSTKQRSSVAPFREYSSFEDHTMIAWLDKDQERQRLVSGNTVWRALEAEYFALTKVKRSWQSLRNRYLRYILPSIWKFGLPSHQVQRLLANYGTGDLRQKKKLRNRDKPTANSLLVLPTVKSAYSRRPKSPDAWLPTKKLEESLPLKSAKRSLRSSSAAASGHPGHTSGASGHPGHTSGASGHPGHTSGEPSQRGKQRAQRTQSEHQTSPNLRKRPANVDECSPTGRGPRGGTPSQRECDSSPISYSEITKRFAMRLRSTPQDSMSSAAPSPIVEKERATRHGRRLYNPRVPL